MKVFKKSTFIDSDYGIGYNIQVNIVANSIIRLNNYAMYHPKSTVIEANLIWTQDYGVQFELATIVISCLLTYYLLQVHPPLPAPLAPHHLLLQDHLDLHDLQPLPPLYPVVP